MNWATYSWDLFKDKDVNYLLLAFWLGLRCKGGLVAAHKSFFQIGAVCAVMNDVGGARQKVFGVGIAVAQP